MNSWLNEEEAANYLGITLENLYQLAQQNRIPSHMIENVRRFSKDELDSWVKANKPINEYFMTVEAAIEDNVYLRDPQREAYTAALEFFNGGGKSAIIQLPVGCGKSGLISILPFGIAKGRVLVIAPNLTIRDELKRTLDITNRRQCFWYKCDILTSESMTAGPYITVLEGDTANIHDCDRSHIVITNIQQLASSADRWLPQFQRDYFSMILVDEGHHSAAASWMKVFQAFPDAHVVNLTATPFRSDRKDIEGDLIYRYSFRRAMIKGYIKRLQASYVAPEEIYFTYKGDKFHHTLDEVLELREEEWFSRGIALAPECNSHIVDASLDKLEKMRVTGTYHQLIAVAMSVNHAKAIRSLYSQKGFKAEEIHSEMPVEKRLEVLQKLKAGLVDCIIQVQMLGEGFDHPHLSVAAIFRPFRSIAPYVQFVGRIMRVIVQNDPRHPDNYGYIVSHIGLNLDEQLDGFRDMDRDDKTFFEDLVSAVEPEPPEDVKEGKARMKLGPDMVVNDEIVSKLFEEDFIDTDDQALIDELRKQAEALGFDGDLIIKAAKQKETAGRRIENAPAPFPSHPQKQRNEARKRLNEEVKRTAKILLNRLSLDPSSRDLATKILPGKVSGPNFAAAVQMIHHEVNRVLGIKSGQHGTLKTDDFIKGQNSLDSILNILTRRLKGKFGANE